MSKCKFKCLQKTYLSVYFLATFSNWLQGPYIYKVYSDYGWSNDSIAYLYVTKYATNCLFGLVVGQLADRCGRKILCTWYTIFFAICCLTKTSSNFFILLCGKILGGISTSILYSVFEAWYLNEHLNFHHFPSDWLNTTFSKATMYNGISAIMAGITGQILVGYFSFSPISSSLVAVPFLIVTFIKIQTTWKEHNYIKSEDYKDDNNNNSKSVLQTLLLIFKGNKVLLLLGIIQCLTESVMYVFIFTWTPVLSYIGPPLGLVFTSFMIALMLGSQMYKVLISRKYRPHELLIFSIFLATISFSTMYLSLKQIQTHESEPRVIKSMSYMCLAAFIVYEFSLGIYYPSIGFLRGRVVPEECRATLINWFRVPMNIITCVCLRLTEGSSDFKALHKCQTLILISSAILIGTIFLSYIFSKKYSKHDTLKAK